MNDQIVSFIDDLKSDKQLASLDEAAIKQTIVMRLLFLLGWDIFNVDEVNQNYKAKNQPIDYALMSQKSDKIFISVQKLGKTLSKSQTSLLEYATKEGVEFAVFTNGLLWWFYLTTAKENLDQKRFCSLDFPNQHTGHIADRLLNFLAQKPVSKGNALKQAEDVLAKRHQRLIEETIPEAWAKVLSEPPNELVDLLMTATEKICGYAAEKDVVVKFLTEDLKRVQSSGGKATRKAPTSEPAKKQEPPKKAAPKKKQEPEKASAPNYAEPSLSSFTFKNKEYPVKSWPGMVVRLCEILRSEYKKDLDRLLWHSVGNKYYFSKKMKELRFPEEIGSTGIFFQTHLSPDELVEVARSIVSFFEYSEDDFSFSLENK